MNDALSTTDGASNVQSNDFRTDEVVSGRDVRRNGEGVVSTIVLKQKTQSVTE